MLLLWMSKTLNKRAKKNQKTLTFCMPEIISISDEILIFLKSKQFQEDGVSMLQTALLLHVVHKALFKLNGVCWESLAHSAHQSQHTERRPANQSRRRLPGFALPKFAYYLTK